MLSRFALSLYAALTFRLVYRREIAYRTVKYGEWLRTIVRDYVPVIPSVPLPPQSESDAIFYGLSWDALVAEGSQQLKAPPPPVLRRPPIP
jgi:hypothetical protein